MCVFILLLFLFYIKCNLLPEWGITLHTWMQENAWKYKIPPCSAGRTFKVNNKNLLFFKQLCHFIFFCNYTFQNVILYPIALAFVIQPLPNVDAGIGRQVAPLLQHTMTKALTRLKVALVVITIGIPAQSTQQQNAASLMLITHSLLIYCTKRSHRPSKGMSSRGMVGMHLSWPHVRVRRTADAGLAPPVGKGFFSQSQLSMQTSMQTFHGVCTDPWEQLHTLTYVVRGSKIPCIDNHTMKLQYTSDPPSNIKHGCTSGRGIENGHLNNSPSQKAGVPSPKEEKHRRRL